MMRDSDRYKIAIVDDELSASNKLVDFLKRFGSENGAEFESVCFSDGLDFLDSYSAEWSVVFMDIDMKIYNGIKTAEKLREKDSAVLLVFVTNLAQFAVTGYKFNSADYLVKPYDYKDFSFTMKQLLKKLKSDDDGEIIIRSGSGNSRVKEGHVTHIEVFGHKVVYHTDTGDMESWGTLSAVQSYLSARFVKCNVSTLVNLDRVSAVRDDEVTVGDFVIPVSRR